MRALSAFLLCALFYTGCAFPAAPDKMQGGCDGLKKTIGAEKYLVRILTKDAKGQPQYLGSGFIIAKSGKTAIATSAHIVFKNIKTKKPHPNGVFVEFTENSKRIVLKAVVAAEKTESDVALLSADHKFPHAAELAKEEGAYGDCILIAGYSFAGNSPAKVSGNFYGYFPLSVKLWNVRVDAQVITAHIIEGVSGGPVFNQHGEVMGVANNSVVIAKDDGTQSRFSLAIPVSELPNLP